MLYFWCTECKTWMPKEHLYPQRDMYPLETCPMCDEYLPVELATRISGNNTRLPKSPSMAVLPDNASLEVFIDEETFRIGFYGEYEPYFSEIYGLYDGESFSTAARRVCVTYDWIDNPPNKEKSHE